MNEGINFPELFRQRLDTHPMLSEQDFGLLQRLKNLTYRLADRPKRNFIPVLGFREEQNELWVMTKDLSQVPTSSKHDLLKQDLKAFLGEDPFVWFNGFLIEDANSKIILLNGKANDILPEIKEKNSDHVQRTWIDVWDRYNLTRIDQNMYEATFSIDEASLTNEKFQQIVYDERFHDFVSWLATSHDLSIHQALRLKLLLEGNNYGGSNWNGKTLAEEFKVSQD